MNKEDKQKIIEQFINDTGSRYCARCSNGNWKVYHTTGNPCPKETAEAGDAGEESVKDGEKGSA